MSFYISYAGSKRREMNEIRPHINWEGISKVVEAFCGSCAFSYDCFSLKTQSKLSFHINDADSDLVAMLNFIKSGRKKEIYEKLQTYRDISTQDYKAFIAPLQSPECEDRLFKWVYRICYRGIQIGATPQSYKKFPQFKSFKAPTPMDNFVQIANITNVDFKVVCEQYRFDSTALLFLDPPYSNCDNRFYSSSPTTNDVDEIYEYLAEFFSNAKGRVLLVVNNCLLMRVLFKNLIKHKYGKKYGVSGAKTEHLVICNQ